MLVGGAGADTLNGGPGDDLMIGGGGVDTFNGGDDFDTILISTTPGNDTIDVTQDAPSAVVGGNYAFTSDINGGGAVQEFITSTNAALAPEDPANLPTVEQIRILAGDGNDAIRVTHADEYVDNNLAAAVGQQMLRFDVDGGGPTASDSLVVRDAGLGDLVLVRQGADDRSGRITIAPARNSQLGEVVYRNIENVDITPLNGVTGGTGTDGLGRVLVFQPDDFEMNDNRLIATQIYDLQTTNRNPTIDPGQGGFVPADEDWYEFRPTKVGTFRFEILFDTVGALANARPGLPGDGNLTISVYNGAGQLIVHGQPNATGDGVAATFSVADDGNEYFLRVQGGTEAAPNATAINTYTAAVTEVDLLGPQVYDPDGPGTTQAIQVVTRNPVTGVLEPNLTFNLFDVKPSQGPTPVVDALLINVRDLLSAELLRRAPGNPSAEVYAAVAATAANPGLYSVVGDADGTMAIDSVDVVNAPTVINGSVGAATVPTTTQFTADGLAEDPVAGDLVVFTSGAASGQIREIGAFNDVTNVVTLANALVNAPAATDTFEVLTIATATIQINFTEPLPDDRFTLTISDSVRDPAENRFDGESDFAQPVGIPTTPSGDGVSGGDFVARFTVDTRPEIATTAGGSIYADINDNMVWDPDNPDFTNRDITFVMGFTIDDVFAGNFVEARGATADGFDKLAVFGPYGNVLRWLIDFDNDGAYDLNQTDAFATANNISGTPIAGNWDGIAANGDEVGLFDGTTFYFDTDHDFQLNAASAISGNLRGLAAAGDFDNDGADDLLTWRDDRFYIDLADDGTPGDTLDGNADVQFFFGFIGAREVPVVADMNADGFDDIGLWVPDREGQPAREAAEWYFLLSTDTDNDGAELGAGPHPAHRPRPSHRLHAQALRRRHLHAIRRRLRTARSRQLRSPHHRRTQRPAKRRRPELQSQGSI